MWYSNYPSLSDWASLAGFSGVKEPEEQPSAQDDLLAQINTPHPVTGIAWHRDQDGNVFLSSSFDPTDITGNGARWMITNLAAKKYDSIRTDKSSIGTTLRPLSNSYVGFSSYEAPHWAYPNLTGASDPSDAVEYKRNPRIGLLYNWDAATLSTTGTIESPTNPNVDPQKNHVQGICPNGWHLPSDWEWTQLEKEINSNTMTYSSATANANGTIAMNVMGERGLKKTDVGYQNGHGNAMKDACVEYSEANTKGISNTISIKSRPGFEVTFNGEAYNGRMYNAETKAFFWLIGQDGTQNGFARRYDSNLPSVTRSKYVVGGHFSVRCKKDIK